MIQAILFDIEGILSKVEGPDFMRNFLGILAPRFSGLLSTEKFSKNLYKALEVTRDHPKPGQTNLQTFYEDFCKSTGQSYQTLQPIFEEFYESDFSTLRCLVKPIPLGAKVVENAIQQGFLTAVAPDYLMPLSAMEERIHWAGLTIDHFRVVPTINHFHYCKPHLGFFCEVAKNLGIKAENCLLVSEHPDDIICRELGMKTFLVGTAESKSITDYAGQLEDLSHLISHGSL